MKVPTPLSTGTAVLCAWLLVAAAPAAGQEGAGERFTASAGVGAGSASLRCDGCTLGNEAGVSLLLHLGYEVRPALVVGAEGSLWRKRFGAGSGESTVALWFGQLVARWYPQTRPGFFLKGGAGLAWTRSRAELPGFGTAETESVGPGGVVGIGWDVAVGSTLALTPYADVALGARTDPTGNAARASDPLGGRIAQAGVALTWR